MRESGFSGGFQGVSLYWAPPIIDEGTPNHFEKLIPMLGTPSQKQKTPRIWPTIFG